MDANEQMAALADLAESLGIEVRRAPEGEPAPRSGGAVVRLGDRHIVFLDDSAPTQERIALLAGALAERPELADRFLPPMIRELLDRAGTEPAAP